MKTIKDIRREYLVAEKLYHAALEDSKWARSTDQSEISSECIEHIGRMAMDLLDKRLRWEEVEAGKGSLYQCGRCPEQSHTPLQDAWGAGKSRGEKVYLCNPCLDAELAKPKEKEMTTEEIQAEQADADGRFAEARMS